MSLFGATGHIGLPYLYLGCGFAKKALFFYFSSSLLCDAENTTTDNIVFRKPTRPSLALRKAFSNPSLSIVFTTPSVPLVGDRNLREEEETAPARRSEPLHSKDGGPSEVCARVILCGMNRMGVLLAYIAFLSRIALGGRGILPAHKEMSQHH